jgi:hypothetical protein
MKYVVALAIFTAFVAVWVTWLRPWLLCQPWAEGFFRSIEPFERIFYRKSETVLWARTKVFIGGVLTMLTQLQAIDITPLLPLIPDAYETWVVVGWNAMPMAISVVGFIDEYMRVKDTTKPIEVVDVPEKIVEQNPAVAEQIATFEAVKKETVSVINAAKDKA